MADDVRDEVLPLGLATVVLRAADQTRRLRVYSASLQFLPGRRRVSLGMQGPDGSVAIEMARAAFWRLTSQFHERSAAADPTGFKQPAPPSRRRRR
jgi:hypothetical protein